VLDKVLDPVDRGVGFPSCVTSAEGLGFFRGLPRFRFLTDGPASLDEGLRVGLSGTMGFTTSWMGGFFDLVDLISCCLAFSLVGNTELMGCVLFEDLGGAGLAGGCGFVESGDGASGGGSSFLFPFFFVRFALGIAAFSFEVVSFFDDFGSSAD